MKFFRLMLLVLGGTSVACDQRAYDVAIINGTSGTIEDAAVRCDRYVAPVGMIVKQGYKGYGPFHGEIPSKFDVEWRSGDGVLHRVTVSTPELPKGFTDTLFFLICPAGDVRPIVGQPGVPPPTTCE